MVKFLSFLKKMARSLVSGMHESRKRRVEFMIKNGYVGGWN